MGWEVGRWVGRLEGGLGGWKVGWEVGRWVGRLGGGLGGWEVGKRSLAVRVVI